MEFSSLLSGVTELANRSFGNGSERRGN
jgi:hypothetical protein